MIPWTCTADRGTLRVEAESLVCSVCDTRYRIANGVPVFGADPALASPLADALWTAEGAVADAADAACRSRSLSRSRFMTDWDFFLPLGESGVVLHAGPGAGDRTLALAANVARVLVLAPGEAQAGLLLRHARERGAQNIDCAVVTGLARLPLPDASVDAVALDPPGASAFGVGSRDLPAVVAEFHRVLKPGGTLMLGARNRLLRLPLVDRLRPGSRRPTLDDALADDGSRPGPPAIRPVLRALRRSGFDEPDLLAPLPRREDIQLVIPVREQAVVRYLFDRLFRKNSAWVRLALGAAKIAARLDLVWWAVPDYFVVAVKPATQKSAST